MDWDRNTILSISWALTFFLFNISGCYAYHRSRRLYPFTRISWFVQYLSYVSTMPWFYLHSLIPILRRDYPCILAILLKGVAIHFFSAQVILKATTLLFLYKTTGARNVEHIPMSGVTSSIHSRYVRWNKWMLFPRILVVLLLLLVPGALLTILLVLVEPKSREHAMCYSSQFSRTGQQILSYGQKIYLGIIFVIACTLTYELRGCKESLSQKQELFWTLVGACITGFLTLVYFPWGDHDTFHEFPFDWIGMGYLSCHLLVNTYWPLFRCWEFHRWTQIQNATVRPIETLRGCLMDNGEHYTRFAQFCMSEFAIENVLFWRRVESWKQVNLKQVSSDMVCHSRDIDGHITLPSRSSVEVSTQLLSYLLHPVKRELLLEILAEARRIYMGFIHPSSESQINLPSLIQKRLDDVFQNVYTMDHFEDHFESALQAKPDLTLWTAELLRCFDDAQEEIYCLVERDSWSRYCRKASAIPTRT